MKVTSKTFITLDARISTRTLQTVVRGVWVQAIHDNAQSWQEAGRRPRAANRGTTSNWDAYYECMSNHTHVDISLGKMLHSESGLICNIRTQYADYMTSIKCGTRAAQRCFSIDVTWRTEWCKLTQLFNISDTVSSRHSAYCHNWST